jgi:hypothetical protein
MNAARRIASIRESSPGTYTFLNFNEIAEQPDLPGAVPALRVPDNHAVATLPADMALKAASGAGWPSCGRVLCRVVESQRVKILFVRAAEPGESWSFSLKVGDMRVLEFLKCCVEIQVFPLLLVGAAVLDMQLRTFVPAQIEAALRAACISEPCSNVAFQRALQALIAGGDPRRLMESLFDPAESNVFARSNAIRPYSTLQALH